MEKFQEARDKALKHLKVAEHMVAVTYPTVQDTKLLVGVMDSLFLALTNAIGALLWYDRLFFKRVLPFHDNFDSKFNMFKEKCVSSYKIDRDIVNIMQEIKEIIVLHRKSPIEFRKKDRFIICAEDYSIKAVTLDQIKSYIKKTKEFVNQINEIVSKDERIFRGSEGRIEAR